MFSSKFHQWNMSRPIKRPQKDSISKYSEKEVRTINYDSHGNSFNQHRNGKGAVIKTKHLALEVEIAESLKQVLEKQKNCRSRLLDVTIIKPTGKTPGEMVETSTVPFGKKEIKDLIRIIEKQKMEKEKHIVEQKQKLYKKISVQKSLLRPRSESPPQKFSSLSEEENQKFVRQTNTVRRPIRLVDRKPRRRPKRESSSAPPNLHKLNYKLDFNQLKDAYDVPQLTSEIRQNYKKCKKVDNKFFDTSPFSGTTSPKSFLTEDEFEEKYKNEHLRNPQVYAAPRTTFEDLQARYKCLNKYKLGKFLNKTTIIVSKQMKEISVVIH